MGSLVLVRHATTAASAGGRNLGQRDDPPLARAGERLAVRLAAALAAELEELPHDQIRLVSSPALRCRQTVAAVARGLGMGDLEVEVAPGLLEIDYGAWDGLTAAECAVRDPERRAAWESDPYMTRCPEGERGADVARRAFGVLRPLESWLAEDRARCAIVVAHNHVNRLWLSAAMGWPMREYRDRLAQDPGGYSLVTFGHDAAVVRRINAAPGADVGTGAGAPL
jgi:broad specificity phosphatase PhoE